MHSFPTRGIGLTDNSALVATSGLGIGTSLVSEGAGRDTGRHRRRFILPDGREISDPTEAYAELERQLRARAAELDAEKSPPQHRKRKRSRSIHPKKLPVLLADRPLPQIIERLPEVERAKIDLELVALVNEVANRRDDEEALILLLT